MTPEQIANLILLACTIIGAAVLGVGGIIVIAIQQRTKIEKEAIRSRQEIAAAAKEASAALPAAVGQQVGDQLKAQFSNFFDFYSTKSEEFNRAVAAIRQELEQVKADRTTLQLRVNEIQNQFNTANAESQEAARRATDAESRLKVLEQAGIDKDQQLLTANATIDQLKGELRTAQTELETTTNSMAELRVRVDTLEGQVRNMTTERDAIIAERDALQTANASLIAERDSAVSERDQARAEITAIQGKLEGVQTELAALRLMVTPPPVEAKPEATA